jgi:hypothetical protein
MQIQETHYDDNGRMTYKGTLMISLSEFSEFGGVSDVTAISGKKETTFFTSWGSGHQ